jgi:hypothetical protein
VRYRTPDAAHQRTDTENCSNPGRSRHKNEPYARNTLGVARKASLRGGVSGDGDAAQAVLRTAPNLGKARVRLEDGTILRINYDGHNGYPFVPVRRTLIERNIIPRKEMSLERISDWMHANPQSAEEVLRQNRSFVFFRIVGLSDDSEQKDAQGHRMTGRRSVPRACR